MAADAETPHPTAEPGEPAFQDAKSDAAKSNGTLPHGQSSAPALKPFSAANTDGRHHPDSSKQDPSKPIPSREGDMPAMIPRPALWVQPTTSLALTLLVGMVALLAGFVLDSNWLILAGALVTVSLSWRLLWPSLRGLLVRLSPQQQVLLIVVPAFLLGSFGLMRAVGLTQAILVWGRTIRWEVVGALGDFLGAFGQIFVAMLALYVAWQQYVISRDLTTQQNRITQQQTIDAYFQGISELVLDDEGMLEDWPQERIIAEARTAAILTSVDASGKAKVIRFLSRSKLLTPLKRDRHLGRPILDGEGGYAEDRAQGVRVIDLNTVLAGADLAGSDLRWAELSEANLVRADLSRCDLARADLSRAILYCALLNQADLMNTRLFYGSIETASPRSRTELPDYGTGAHTGAVVEGANFFQVKRLSEEQRQYCCRWGGEATRQTIPGGCDGIPNCLDS
ncbi:pentapeptide repeat-containing protein [Leptolyngbya sp. PCC 6406]|uniref:pentapeptide repeat-containing protein n=1 Tax=Leptolyngbya sp. PCC 6406 TaxID=1173264 RepID=UPI0002ACFC14|nr:pentapeptide repeat-containing protein [Leptolyngbya sp. PCC 6406]